MREEEEAQVKPLNALLSCASKPRFYWVQRSSETAEGGTPVPHSSVHTGSQDFLRF